MKGKKFTDGSRPLTKEEEELTKPLWANIKIGDTSNNVIPFGKEFVDIMRLYKDTGNIQPYLFIPSSDSGSFKDTHQIIPHKPDDLCWLGIDIAEIVCCKEICVLQLETTEGEILHVKIHFDGSSFKYNLKGESDYYQAEDFESLIIGIDLIDNGYRCFKCL